VSLRRGPGSIWSKRSNTPSLPKSGDAEDQTAPTLAAASMAITVSGRLGIIPAIRSPGRMPRFRNQVAAAATWAASSR
jgi:hypothetical protein